MIVKKQIGKHSIKHTFIQGDKYFYFEEYFEDSIQPDYDKRRGIPPLKKGHIRFQYLLPKEKWFLGSPTWFPVDKNITNLKDAKKFVKNREYL